MNLVLDAFERALYPRGTAGAKRRASTSGLVMAASGPLASSTSSSGASHRHHHHHHPHRHHQQQHHVPNPIPPPPPPHSRMVMMESPPPPTAMSPPPAGQQKYRAGRRGTTAGAFGTITPAAGRGEEKQRPATALPQSSSLTGLDAKQLQQQFAVQKHGDEVEVLEQEQAMAQHDGGGGHSVNRSRSSAAAHSGRHKKSSALASTCNGKNLGRKQSIASLLFTAMASPVPSGGERAGRRRQSRANAHQHHQQQQQQYQQQQQHQNGPPPRQWSMPERETGATEEQQQQMAAGNEQPEEEQEPFWLVQRTRSMALCASPPPPLMSRQMSNQQQCPDALHFPPPHHQQQHPQQHFSSPAAFRGVSIGSSGSNASSAFTSPMPSPFFGGQNAAGGGIPPSSSTFLLGFMVRGRPSTTSTAAAANCFHQSPALNASGHRRASATGCRLAEDWARIRAAEPSAHTGMLLRCVNAEPAIPYVQFACFPNTEQCAHIVNELVDARSEDSAADEQQTNANVQYGCYEELFALERAHNTRNSNFASNNKSVFSAASDDAFPNVQGGTLQQQQQPFNDTNANSITTIDDAPPPTTSTTTSLLSSSRESGGGVGVVGNMMGNHRHHQSHHQSTTSINNAQQQQQQQPHHHHHRGFIFVCFQLLQEQLGGGGAAVGGNGGNFAAEHLESSWLSWTGAAQIYTHSPRSWALRRVSLLRRAHLPAPPHQTHQPDSPPHSQSAPFVYVLCCEFDAILHPANAVAALDMCERLRARNCGLVALYQVRHAFSPDASEWVQSPATSSQWSLSPHWGSPMQTRRQLLGRMGRSHDERIGSDPTTTDDGTARKWTTRSMQRDGGGGGISLLRRVFKTREQYSLGWEREEQQQQPVMEQQQQQHHAKIEHKGMLQQQQHWQGEPDVGTSL